MVHRKILPRAITYQGSRVIMKEMLRFVIECFFDAGFTRITQKYVSLVTLFASLSSQGATIFIWL